MLATQAYQQLGDATGNGDDEVLANVVNAIKNRLKQDRRVPNPVDRAEDLNRLQPDQFATVLRQLEAFADRAMQAAAAQDQLTAAMLWSDIFLFVFPMPEDQEVAPAGGNLPATTIVPEITVTATVRKTGQHVATYRNEVPPIPKECSLSFEIVNPQQIPPDATIEWTVRNDGRDAENANDLGHIKSRGRRELSVVERTLYHGRHYMDCVIRRSGQVIGRRRVPVHIQRHVYPVRNPPKPAYVAHR